MWLQDINKVHFSPNVEFKTQPGTFDLLIVLIYLRLNIHSTLQNVNKYDFMVTIKGWNRKVIEMCKMGEF